MSQSWTVCTSCGGANFSCSCYSNITATPGTFGTVSTSIFQGIANAYGMGTATSAATQQPVSYKSYEELEYERLDGLAKKMETGTSGVYTKIGVPYTYPRWLRWAIPKCRWWGVWMWPVENCSIEEAENILAKRLDGNWTIVNRRVGPHTELEGELKNKTVWVFYLEPIREN